MRHPFPGRETDRKAELIENRFLSDSESQPASTISERKFTLYGSGCQNLAGMAGKSGYLAPFAGLEDGQGLCSPVCVERAQRAGGQSSCQSITVIELVAYAARNF